MNHRAESINDAIEHLEEARRERSRMYDALLVERGKLEKADEDNELLRGLLRECEPAVYAQHMDTLGTRIAKPTTLLARVRAALAGAAVQPSDALDAARYQWLRDRAWPFEFKGDTPEDADAAIDAAMHLAARPAAAKKHTPECSYWDGLMAQVCNCGLTERCCVDYPRCDCNSPPEPGDETSAQLAEAQRSLHSADPVIHAQHGETGRMWTGPRSQLPRRYFECSAPGIVP